MNIDLENWMGNLPLPLRTLPLIFLAIPGSHDSTTYNLTSRSKIAPDVGKNLIKLRILGPFFRFIVKKWSVTQSLSITDQLKSGIRYFDLRIATYFDQKLNKDLFKFVHGLYGDDIEKVLEQFTEFLNRNPQEVVFIDCQHFYAFNHDNHSNLVKLFQDVFSTKLVPSKLSIFDLSLNYLESKRLQVILIYRNENMCQTHDFLWSSDLWPTPWPDTVHISELIEKLNQGLQTRDLAKAYITQFVITPSTSFICRNFFSNLRQTGGFAILQDKFDWIRKRRAGIYGKLNIIISDFIELENYQFPKMVIELNYLSLEEDGNDDSQSEAAGAATPVAAVSATVADDYDYGEKEFEDS